MNFSLRKWQCVCVCALLTKYTYSSSAIVTIHKYLVCFLFPQTSTSWSSSCRPLFAFCCALILCGTHTCTNLTHSLKWYSSNQLIREMSIYQIGYEWVPLSLCSCLCIQYICTNVLIYIEPCRVCVRSLSKLWMCLLLILQKFKFVTVAAATAAAHNRA